ncbi:hypothetical protein BUL40_08330 [Croceivirga radicis]|uniref:Uncharacterized protein n=1 Tax=Croceivirga radicis TaxID=1929488 RepID=A0A1V6LSX6_9FLAO|nr:hypothetical protein [Croceivirga radicis]OQD43086.1 hypothetical protein BUL40_08330 [Croceivirga radicis]
MIGYGSFFHEIGLKDTPKQTIVPFKDHLFFYAGRYAIKYILECIKKHQNIATIWLPEYYCPYVKDWMHKNFTQIKYYPVDPFAHEPQIPWSYFLPTDVVLLNNYWGLHQFNPPMVKERPLIVEDHSHGWLSAGALNSKADFCVASLRKTVPLPLGGIVWKPNNSRLQIPLKEPDLLEDHDFTDLALAWDTMAKAMHSKATCRTEQDKQNYLQTYAQGEAILKQTMRVTTMAPEHQKALELFVFKDYNKVKKDNLNKLYSLLRPSIHFKILAKPETTPFGLILLFKDRKTMLLCKDHLIKNKLFPAELWPDNLLNLPYNCMLNIHVDLRYTPVDMQRMANIINQWNPDNHV